MTITNTSSAPPGRIWSSYLVYNTDTDTRVEWNTDTGMNFDTDTNTGKTLIPILEKL